jgi:ADP-heptose:LPS heptosyltransferase
MVFGKRLEHIIKDTAAAFLRKILEQSSQTPRPPFHRILFLRFDVLGDMILSIPIFKTTRTVLPNAEIDVLCSQKNYILLEQMTLTDHLYIYKKNPLHLFAMIWRIRKKKYDLIINLVTRASFTFGIVARLGGPHAVRLAADQEQFSYFYNHIVELPPKSEIHMLKRKFLLCAEIINDQIRHTDIPWIDFDTTIKHRAGQIFRQILMDLDINADNTHVAAINLSAGLARREWPLEKNVHFLKQAVNKYQDKIAAWVVITNPAKPHEARELVSLVNNPRVRAIPAQSDFRVIIEFLHLITVLVTPDTSIMHAASATGTPVLALMIRENIKIWDPIGAASKIVLSSDPFTLKDLSVEKVLEGFNQLMQQLEL